MVILVPVSASVCACALCVLSSGLELNFGLLIIPFCLVSPKPVCKRLNRIAQIEVLLNEPGGVLCTVCVLYF